MTESEPTRTPFAIGIPIMTAMLGPALLLPWQRRPAALGLDGLLAQLDSVPAFIATWFTLIMAVWGAIAVGRRTDRIDTMVGLAVCHSFAVLAVFAFILNAPGDTAFILGSASSGAWLALAATLGLAIAWSVRVRRQHLLELKARRPKRRVYRHPSGSDGHGAVG